MSSSNFRATASGRMDPPSSDERMGLYLVEDDDTDDPGAWLWRGAGEGSNSEGYCCCCCCCCSLDRPGELRRGNSGDAFGTLPRSTEITPKDDESAAVDELPPGMRLALRSERENEETKASFAGTSGLSS